MEEPPVFKSLSKGQAREILRKYGLETLFNILTGNYGGLLQTGSAVYTDHVTRQASEEQRQAFQAFKKAIPELINRIESKEIRVAEGAFNSAPRFIAAFQSAAALGIVLALMDLSSAIKRVGSSLEGIRDELAKGIVAKVQGWEQDGFGSHVYRFVRTEMVAHQRSRAKHFFYVWNPDTDWYQRFEERQREEPLGSNFGGYNTDLGALCLWMSRNRQVLRETTSYGTEAVFHLLIPAYCPIVTDEPMIFHQSLFPLVITGQRHQCTDFVWFNLPLIPPGLTLQYVGILTKILNQSTKWGYVGFLACWCGAAGCAVAGTMFPPCAVAAASLGVTLCQGAMGSGFTAVGGLIYDELSLKSPRILGKPVLIHPQPGSGGP